MNLESKLLRASFLDMLGGLNFKYSRLFGFILAAMILVCSAAFANGAGGVAIESAVREAWLKYEKGDYKGAREVVDKFHGERYPYLMLMSAALYEKEGKCSEAVKIVYDVSRSYDLNREVFGDISKGEDNEAINFYLGLKKIGMKCNYELKDWAGFVGDAVTYMELSHDPGKNRVLPMLGYAHKQIAIESINLAISYLSKVASGAQDQGSRERVNFHLTHLYFMAGQIENSISSAEHLLKVAKEKGEWVEQMKKLPGVNERVLGSGRVKELLKREMALQ